MFVEVSDEFSDHNGIQMKNCCSLSRTFFSASLFFFTKKKTKITDDPKVKIKSNHI